MAASSTTTITTAVSAVDAANTPMMEATTGTSSTPLQSSSTSVVAATTPATPATSTVASPQHTDILLDHSNESKSNVDTSFAVNDSTTTTINNNVSDQDLHVLPSSQGCNTATAATNRRNIASKADRLNDLKLMESFFFGTPLPVVTKNKNSAKAVENVNAFTTMEILQEHLLQTNHTSDDERLLNQIIQSSDKRPTKDSKSQDPATTDGGGVGGGSSSIISATTGRRGFNFATLRHIQDETTPATISNRSRSSLSRQSSVATTEMFLNNAFDTSHMNSTAWKPMFQQDHQEIPYSPAHIFEESKSNIASTVPATTNGSTTGIHTATSSLVGSSPSSIRSTVIANGNVPVTDATATPAQNATIHTAGAETLLLAAQVLHEETSQNGNKNHETEANAVRRKNHSVIAAVPRITTLKNNCVGRSNAAGSVKRARTLKQDDIASTEKDFPNEINVPEGHAKVEDDRIAILIPDADITKNDVLLGRGGRTNHHIGNATYRTYKESLQEEYLHATKDEKTSISNRLVQMIHEKHGRFLKAYEPTKNATGMVEFWYEVDLLTARKKASQALREINTPEMRAAKRAKYRAGK